MKFFVASMRLSESTKRVSDIEMSSGELLRPEVTGRGAVAISDKLILGFVGGPRLRGGQSRTLDFDGPWCHAPWFIFRPS